MREYFYHTFPAQLARLRFRQPNEVVREHIMDDPGVVFFGGRDWETVQHDLVTVPLEHRARFVLSLFMIVLTDQALHANFRESYDSWRAVTNFPKFGWSGFGPHNENPFKILWAPEREGVIDNDEVLLLIPEFVQFLVSETTIHFQQHLQDVDVPEYFASIRQDRAYRFDEGTFVPRAKAEFDKLTNS